MTNTQGTQRLQRMYNAVGPGLSTQWGLGTNKQITSSRDINAEKGGCPTHV